MLIQIRAHYDLWSCKS